MAKVEYRLFKNPQAAQPYHWTVVSTGNWKTLAHSENYANRQDAIDAALLVRDNSAGADFMDHTGD